VVHVVLPVRVTVPVTVVAILVTVVVLLAVKVVAVVVLVSLVDEVAVNTWNSGESNAILNTDTEYFSLKTLEAFKSLHSTSSGVTVSNFATMPSTDTKAMRISYSNFTKRFCIRLFGINGLRTWSSLRAPMVDNVTLM